MVVFNMYHLSYSQLYNISMKITKLGHCCLLIETKGKRILTDPGSYTIDSHSNLQDIDAVLFTHEHGDHFHVESLKVILQKNPNAQIYANSSVGEILATENIPHHIVNHGDQLSIDEVSLLGIGEYHAPFHSSVPPSHNTGFFIDNRLWYPGDAFTEPNQEVDILALPVAGPWMSVKDGIDYCLKIRPRVAFPVHDGIRYGATHKFPAEILPTHGIEFVVMLEGDSREF